MFSRCVHPWVATDVLHVFCSVMFLVDLSATYGTGHPERQEAASAAAPEEAGQASLFTVTRRDLMPDTRRSSPGVQVTEDGKPEQSRSCHRCELLNNGGTPVVQEKATIDHLFILKSV